MESSLNNKEGERKEKQQQKESSPQPKKLGKYNKQKNTCQMQQRHHKKCRTKKQDKWMDKKQEQLTQNHLKINLKPPKLTMLTYNRRTETETEQKQ